EQLWADKPSVYRGRSARSKVWTARARMSARAKSKAAACQATAEEILRDLLRGLFQQTLLELFLALDAVTRPRHRLQPLGINLFATVHAFPEAALTNPREGVLHHH